MNIFGDTSISGNLIPQGYEDSLYRIGRSDSLFDLLTQKIAKADMRHPDMNRMAQLVEQTFKAHSDGHEYMLDINKKRFTWSKSICGTSLMCIQRLPDYRIIFLGDGYYSQYHTDKYSGTPQGPRRYGIFEGRPSLITEIMRISKSFTEIAKTNPFSHYSGFKNSKLEIYYKYTGNILGYTESEQDYFIKYKGNLVFQCCKGSTRYNAWLYPNVLTLKKGDWIDYLMMYDDVSYAPLNVIEQLLND